MNDLFKKLYENEIVPAGTLAKLERMREALEWVNMHWDNQDINHADYRVFAGMRASEALEDTK